MVRSKAPARPKFNVNVSLDSKTFTRIEAPASARLQKKSSKTFKIALKKSECTERLRFLLELVCDTSASLNLRFCDVEEMTQTNAMFRGKNKATDVLSFVPHQSAYIAEFQETGFAHLGDLLICVPVCEMQARQRKLSLSDEIERMVIHGLVHLKGFDHERGDAAWKVMSKLERALSLELTASFGPSGWIVQS